MSHRPERKENDCLNCGTIVHGRYCQFCGQQNVEPKETVWELVTHFVYDLTHFDGNFFSTSKYLLFRPGFLSLEYTKGRRVRYLNPIRMYIFISAFFFLFFFSVVKTEDAIKLDSDKTTYSSVKKKIEEKKRLLNKSVDAPGISPQVSNIIKQQIALLTIDEERLKTDTTKLSDLNYFKMNGFDVTPSPFKTAKEYDSVQATLKKADRDGWIERKIRIQKLNLTNKYNNDNKLILNKLVDKFLHSFPQVLFVSLPLFALLLKLLYIRRRTRFYYVDHIIYAVHLYCAMFIFIFLMMSFSRLADSPYLGWIDFFNYIVFFYTVWYVYKSMRNFYQQSRGKTILKYLMLLFISFFIMSLLFMTFFIFSAFTI